MYTLRRKGFLIYSLLILFIFLFLFQSIANANSLTGNKLKVVKSAPPLVVLGIFYLLTNIISNNASVVLMIPVAVDAAQQLGANPFSFILAVTFAASTAFLTPMGYQTNLMVYGPGGYQFRDFMIVGAPLQLLLAIITPLCIAFFWGL
ncbi:hypothetical protein JCM16358_03440 [Halanaerocella petrolearia]